MISHTLLLKNGFRFRSDIESSNDLLHYDYKKGTIMYLAKFHKKQLSLEVYNSKNELINSFNSLKGFSKWIDSL
ncbi:protein of unknown function [Tenacibaculum sp. 190130A14a]|uniref:Uncharacterized protein n=1 Tax=Tenacibaculum polynesiense TaxID=3137857 RepID=A0ABP1F1N7_9FLAO